ncbi:uncharacterized protein LOC131606166 [Vicia villosa]|uniref:uncharacterized protein LOC131606166 n=1 Tax=Vicia villosa TaxID=3911 RepID=UPI00273C5E85|nr:uncharacterized protein LOC131606166 [Vicia villosa]
MASNNNTGEERRRRLAERGSDRMALITGRINALPPTPPSITSSPSYRHGQSMSVSAFDSHFDNVSSPLPRHARPHSLASSAFASDFNQDNAGNAEEHKQDASMASRLKHQGGFKYSNFEAKTEDEPLFEDSKPKLTKSSSIEKLTECLNMKQAKRLHKWSRDTFFSSRELNFSILASENTRALSSLIIALVVVFYYIISSKSIFASRPIYVVLITDVTIVVARIYREKAKVLKERQGQMAEAGEDGQNWGDAVKLLERGLVLYQAIRGFFIDCSIYLVVVVCCISLM